MNIAVCEDDMIQIESIRSYMQDYCNRNCYMCEIHSFNNGEDLLSRFRPGAFDLIFLDIHLPGLSGIDAAQKIREIDTNCILIFVTVSKEYALEAFSVQATSYLLKPVTDSSMEKALAMCKETFAENSRVIEAPMNGVPLKIPLANILYIEVYGKQTHFHLTTGDVKTYMPLDVIEKTLGGSPFLRCHRCYLVNMKYVADIRAENFLMKNGDDVPIRQKGRKEIKMAMGSFLTRGA